MHKKILAIMMALALIFVAVSCNGDGPNIDDFTETNEESVLVMKEQTLSRCVGMADEKGVYKIADGVIEIGEGCFSGDTRIKKVILSDSVKTISSGAFAGCKNLEEVVLTENVETIGSFAFYYCESLEKINIEDTKITNLYGNAFVCNYSLEEIVLPETLENIGHTVFAGCSLLTYVNFPKTLQIIGTEAFASCTSLENVDISECTSLETIGSYAFNACRIKSIVLPEGLKTIEAAAFADCKKLTSVTISSTVQSISSYAFLNTPWIEELTEEPYVIVGDGVLLKCNEKPEDGTIDLSGKGIKSIAGSAFENASYDESAGYNSKYGYKYASSLTSIEIPEGVTEINAGAFYYCSSLKEIKLPSTLETIGADAFHVNESGSTHVSIVNCTNLKMIGVNAFYGCGGMKAEDVKFTSDIGYVGTDAFFQTNFLNSFWDSHTSSESEASYLVVDNVLLGVNIPKGVTAVVIPEGVRVIAGSAVSGWNVANYYDTEEKAIAAGLNSYSMSRWYASNRVTVIGLASTVEEICDQAFFRLQQVQTLAIPPSVKNIYQNAFSYWEKLTTIYFSEGLEYIGQNAFNYCTVLKTFKLPTTLKNVESGVFGACMAIREFSFPIGVESIGSDVFVVNTVAGDVVYSENLTIVNIPHFAKPVIYDIIGMNSSITVNYMEPIEQEQ